MDNLTHSLVGIAAAKAGLERLSPAATPLCILAANAPDGDIAILLFGDRWSFLEHHRGITHAIIGTVTIGILLPVIFYVVDLVVAKLRQRPRQVKFLGLLFTSLIVSATHPLLDWTNNYGIRFLLPWSRRWFYGDFVFIVDPFIWLILGGACFLLSGKTRSSRIVWIIAGLFLTFLVMANPRGGSLPRPWLIRSLWVGAFVTLAVLAYQKIGERWGARLAWVSFGLLVLYWCGLGFAHSHALSRAEQEAAVLARPGEIVSRVAAMPTLANPFSWDCVFETNKATYRFNLAFGSESAITRTVRYEKPTGQLERALNKVSTDRRAEVFLGFARFPVAKLSSPDCTSQTIVQLADLRYTEPGTSRGSFSLELPVECNDALPGNR